MADPGSLTLHYDFANDHSLSARIGPTLTITRTTTATYFDAAGILKTAANGEARTFSHNPSTGESLGLLVEEARTNICLQSEDFASASWSEGGNALAVVGNEAVAPDGTLTADRLTDVGSAVTKAIPVGAAILTGFSPVVVQEGISDHPLGTLNLVGSVPKINITTTPPGTGNVFIDQSITVATSTAHTMSVYLKADGLNWARVRFQNNGALTILAFFDLNNGVVGATTGADNTSEFIEDIGDGIFRCGIVFDTDAVDTTGSFTINVADDNNDVIVDLDGTSSIFCWGADLQEGAFPTSYIKTTTVAVTRNADVVNTTTVDWFNAAAGTLYADWRTSVPVGSRTNNRIMQLQTNGSNEIRLYLPGNDDLTLLVDEGGVNSCAVRRLGSSDAVDIQHKSAFAIATDDFIFYSNGLVSLVDTSGDVPALTNVWVGSDTVNFINGHIAEIRYYDERWPNSVLEAMSNGVFPSGTKGAHLRKKRRKQRRLREFVETPGGEFVEIFTQTQADELRASFAEDEPEIEERKLFRMTPEVIELLDSFRSRK